MSGGYDSLPTGGSAYDERLALLDGIRLLHAEVTRLALPLDLPGTTQMRRERESVLGLLDGYLVSRLSAGDRPLLAVIGGPTGAGKSTILNSLVGAPVSPASVLRPTTRTPVLLYNPVDERAVMSPAVLPGLETTTMRGGGSAGQGAGPGGESPLRSIRLVARPEVPPGLAVLDSPDLDSWLASNRELATELLGIADLWIFATTGTDYADAVPWSLLDGVTERRVTIAAVLNRMRPGEITAVRQHFAQMLTERGLPGTPVFTIPELVLIDERIPYEYVAQLNNWLAQQSGVDDVRESYLDRAVHGTLDQVLRGVRRLIEAAGDQVVAERRLRVDLTAIFSYTREEIRALLGAGALTEPLREAWRGVPDHSGGRFLRRLGALRGAEPHATVAAALRTALTALVTQRVGLAMNQVAERWTSHPAGGSVGAAALEGLAPDFAARADAVLVSWLGRIEEHLGLRHERHAVASRWSPETLALATLAVLPPGDGESAATALRTLTERGGPSAANDAPVALGDLLGRLDVLIGEEEHRLGAVLDRARISPSSTSALRQHLDSLERLKRIAFS